MPYLPPTHDLETRFRLTARRANAELRAFQKRRGRSGTDVPQLDAHSPTRLLATTYLSLLERVDAKQPPHRRTGVKPQGELDAWLGAMATCGVSSIGSTAAFFRRGMYDVSSAATTTSTTTLKSGFAADYRDLRISVRAREGEFLIGSTTDWEGVVGFGVSYDGSVISDEAAEVWAERIRGLLEIDREMGKL